MNLVRILRRAVTASPHELRVRTRQMMFKRINEILLRGSRTIFPANGYLESIDCSPADVPAWVRGRRSRWLLDDDRILQIQRHFQDAPELAAQLFARAGRILKDEMYVLGHGPVPFTGDDKWHKDHILGIVSPKRFYGRIRYLDCHEVGDSKHVWEPNRFAWAYWLGAAHVITGERRWSERFCELTSSWFDDNPYPVGINYCSALEIALRAYAWVWAMELFRNQESVVRSVFPRLLQGLWIGCRHIENNLSYYFAPNTHLLGEAFALFVCGICFPEFKESRRWRSLGYEILAREGIKQFHSDGMHRELSTCYHLYATDLYVQATMIAMQKGYALSPAIETTARRAATRLAELVTADGTLPRLNDCDDGRVDWFCLDPLDAKPSLLAAETLWPDVALSGKVGASNGYHVWMTPPASNPTPGDSTGRSDARGMSFPETYKLARPSVQDSGIVTYRNTSRDYLLFRAGPFGYLDCGHSHDNPTSLILHLAGKPVIVDSGTGAYTQSRQIRNQFRTASANNILTLAGCEPSLPGDWFDWHRTTPTTLRSAQRSNDRFEGAAFHDGFNAALGFPARVGRSVLMEPGIALVVDQWNAGQAVSARLAWTLHPDLDVEWEACDLPCDFRYWRGALRDSAAKRFYFLVCCLPGVARLGVGPRDDGNIQLDDEGAAHVSREMLDLNGAQLSVSHGPYSPGYGVVRQTRNLVIQSTKSTTGHFVTALSVRSDLQLSLDGAGQLALSAGRMFTSIATLEVPQAVN